MIARAAAGRGDDILTATLLSYDGPRLIAPAMNPFMYTHAAVQRNIKILKDDGYELLAPKDGAAVCGDEGEGKMMEVTKIISRINEFSA